MKVLNTLYNIYAAIIRLIFLPLIEENTKTVQTSFDNLSSKIQKMIDSWERTNNDILQRLDHIESDNRMVSSDISSDLALTQRLSANLDDTNDSIHSIQQYLNCIDNTTHMILSSVSNDSQLYTMCAQLYNEREWTRNAVYELRDETRVESTTLQKLQEQDIRLNEEYRNETHRHIDFTYRDLMLVLRSRSDNWGMKADLKTDYPIAYESNDTKVPHGTIRDNTRCPRFISRCEEVFNSKHTLNFLDLGCSGGGMVLDALLKGHYSLGLEGSDASLRQQRAEWRLIPDHLKTCDISKPFRIFEHGSQTPLLFDIVTAWEVLEHIPEKDIPQLFANIYAALAPDGLFVATIAAKQDIDPETGVNWHVNINPFSWWEKMLNDSGFTLENELFSIYDLARGVYNPPHCYEAPYDVSKANFEEDFYVVARKKTLNIPQV